MNIIKTYLCYTSYAATGEGNYIWLSVEFAKNLKEAKEKHFKKFNIDKYFHRGCEVWESSKKNEKTIKSVLEGLLSKQMAKALLEKNPITKSKEKFWGLGKLQLHIDINRS